MTGASDGPDERASRDGVGAADAPPVDDPYRTVAGPGTVEVTVGGSRFRGVVRGVERVDAAEDAVAEIREAHPDATHVVYAYRVRVASGGGWLLREYQRDDGEPAGSAGKPALNVLQGRDLENVVAIVVRYYGGRNLGVGGLARAYGRAVADAVDAAGVTTRRPRVRLEIGASYDDSGTVRGILEHADCAFDATYEATVAFDVTVARADADALADRLRDATSGRVDVEET